MTKIPHSPFHAATLDFYLSSVPFWNLPGARAVGSCPHNNVGEKGVGGTSVGRGTCLPFHIWPRPEERPSRRRLLMSLRAAQRHGAVTYPAKHPRNQIINMSKRSRKRAGVVEVKFNAMAENYMKSRKLSRLVFFF